MSNNLWQINFKIDGLIPKQVKLRRKIWLNKNEILLEKKGDFLDVYLLHEGDHTFGANKKLLPYLKFSPLLSNNRIHLEGGSGSSLTSRKELGKINHGNIDIEMSVHFPDEAVQDIENYAPHFLRQIKSLHDKYANTVSENEFLVTALDFFYDANNEGTHNDHGFICAVICLESLFNEGPSDINYKISHRAAFLIGLGNENSIAVFKNLKSIYKNRNKLIHGAGSPPPNNENYLISRYARLSITIFLILLKNKKRAATNKNKRKEELLIEIDNAMLDPIKRTTLQKEIGRGLKNFNLSVPRTYEGKEQAGREYRVTAW